jgi:exodeoxyribonuclease V beta subunit
MLRGFIDLVIEHDGQFWVVDYKSNWLGTTPAAYDEAATAAAVREHRYDLQYLLYSVALRRLLRQRLPRVDVNDHFGGVLYLFLRGMDGSGRHGMHRDRPEPALLDAIEASFDAAATEGVA